MWPLYEDAWWHDGSGGSEWFGVLVLIILLCIYIDDEIKKNKETCNKKPQHHDMQTLKMEDENHPKPVHRITCGTPFIQAKREQERRERERIEREKELDKSVELLKELIREREKEEAEDDDDDFEMPPPY